MGVQRKLATHFRELAQAEDGDRARNLEAWGDFVEPLPDDDPHVEAIARSQAQIGSPERFTPRCDGGLHVRLLNQQAPTPFLLEYLASLEGMPAPWVYGDWATEGPRPERDGVPQWTVDVELITPELGLRWPPRIEHPQIEPVTHYGINDVDLHAHLSVSLFIWAATEEEATRLADGLVDAHIVAHPVTARRSRTYRTPGEFEDKPRGPRDLETRPGKVRWQRADVEGRTLQIVWDSSGDPFDHVEVAETRETVTVTLYELQGPSYTPEGIPIACASTGGVHPLRVEVELETPLGERVLLDGSTGRAPGDLDVWEYHERERREEILALPLERIRGRTSRTPPR